MADDITLVEAIATAKAFAEQSKESSIQAAQCYNDAATLLAAEISIHQKNKESTETKAKGQPLRNYLEGYYEYSGSASENNRKIAFAGIAIIWVFKTSVPNSPYLPVAAQQDVMTLPTELIWPLLLLSCSLALDLLQYLLGTILWGTFYESEFKKVKADPLLDENSYLVEAPKSRSLPINILFFMKFVPTIAAYILIFIFLQNKLFQGYF